MREEGAKEMSGEERQRSRYIRVIEGEGSEVMTQSPRESEVTFEFLEEGEKESVLLSVEERIGGA